MTHLLDYIVFDLWLTTENCFEHMTRLFPRTARKNQHRQIAMLTRSANIFSLQYLP
jgi:hypothetical protein